MWLQVQRELNDFSLSSFKILTALSTFKRKLKWLDIGRFSLIFNVMNVYLLAVNGFPSSSPKLTQDMNFLYLCSHMSRIARLANLLVNYTSKSYRLPSSVTFHLDGSIGMENRGKNNRGKNKSARSPVVITFNWRGFYFRQRGQTFKAENFISNIM